MSAFWTLGRKRANLKGLDWQINFSGFRHWQFFVSVPLFRKNSWYTSVEPFLIIHISDQSSSGSELLNSSLISSVKSACFAKFYFTSVFRFTCQFQDSGKILSRGNEGWNFIRLDYLYSRLIQCYHWRNPSIRGMQRLLLSNWIEVSKLPYHHAWTKYGLDSRARTWMLAEQWLEFEQE